MRGIRHPFSKALYEQDGDGHVRVVEHDGRTGRFQSNGQWIDGELEEADPHLCGWVAGPQVGNHRVTDQPAAASS